jgi:ADP-ribose pyrophosphatase YjhB (NUDIX family)
MSPLLKGDGIGRTASGLSVAASAVILDGQDRVLLVRREDTGLWGLPGGVMEPGERVSEAVRREVAEETGLEVRPERLVGVYSDPDLVVVYPGVAALQPVVLCFACEVDDGTPRAMPPETSDVGYFAVGSLPPLVEAHRERITDALARLDRAFIR